jgi:TPR repeat protein
MVRLAQVYGRDGDFERARQWLKRAAGLGNAEAKESLALWARYASVAADASAAPPAADE